jgi:hypothetical protein
MAFYPNEKKGEENPALKRRKNPNDLVSTYGEHVKERHDWIDKMDWKVPGTQKTFRQYLAENPDIDNPALFMASMFEEGTAAWAQGVRNFGEDGLIERDISQGKAPYRGWGSFGLDTIGNRADEFIKRGLLPKDFKSRYQPIEFYNDNVDPSKRQWVKSGDFKDFNDVIAAKKAYFKAEREDFEKWANQNNLKLSDNAKDLFQVVAYNGGQGLAREMAQSWSKNGMLENDKFLRQAPAENSYHQTWVQNMRRLQGSNMLKNEAGLSGRDIKWERPKEYMPAIPNRPALFDVQKQQPLARTTETPFSVSGRPSVSVQAPAVPGLNTQQSIQSPIARTAETPFPAPTRLAPSVNQPSVPNVIGQRPIPQVQPTASGTSPFGPTGMPERKLAGIPQTPDRVIAPPPQEEQSFGSMFAKSRKEGLAEFTWKGKKFTTQTKEEAQKPKGFYPQR